MQLSRFVAFSLSVTACVAVGCGSSSSDDSNASGGNPATGGTNAQAGGSSATAGSSAASGASSAGASAGGASAAGANSGGTSASGAEPSGMAGEAGSDAAGGEPSTGPSTKTVCEILAAAGNPCVAAHSTTRVLYAGYKGPLYQVCRGVAVAGADSCVNGTTKDIGAVNGRANAAAQDAFCAGGICSISVIYDQTPNANHLKPAPAGGAKNTPDLPARASVLKTTLDGHEVYGVLIEPGQGYRILKAKGTATGDAAETMYEVSSQQDIQSNCCFDYGNGETDAHDDGNGTMEALYIGGTGPNGGPVAQADLENGLYAGAKTTALKYDFLSAMLVGDTQDKNAGKGRYAIYGGDATQGPLKSTYDGPRPDNKPGYVPMKKQGSIILGIGGDNSNRGGGRWYEGAMTTGAATAATLGAVQANIVAAGYGK